MHPTKLTGARTHNLDNLSLELRPGELVALTGVSGAGKSALALDTLYAEGQRRFIESFSPYARQFLERLERPPVESLEPVPAGVAVDRRAPVKSSRSTVATMADLEPYLSALFTREAVPVCPTPGCNHVEAKWTSARESARRVADVGGPRTLVTYPVLANGTAGYLEVREGLAKDGYRRLLLDGVVRDLDDVKPSEALAADDLAVVIDRLDPRKDESRLALALEEAFRRGDGRARLVPAEGPPVLVTRGLSCPSCSRTFDPPRPSLFSYQSPVGACPTCKGFGRVIGIDWSKVFPDPTASLKKGAVRPWSGNSSKQERALMVKFCEREGIPMDVPWGKLSAAHQRRIVDGDGTWSKGRFPGVKAWFTYLESRTYKMHVRVLLSRYRSYDTCATCEGRRLAPMALAYRVGGQHLAAWHEMEIADALALLQGLTPATAQGALVVRELASRLGYLARVGLGYLSLDRQSRTLSGGEAQRVSLTAGLGTSLTGALFVLDEPTVGLHPSDTPPLADAMRELAVRGNTVVVIEHDLDIVQSVDRVVELGPGAGPHGGKILFDGSPGDLAKRADLPTGSLLAGRGGQANGARSVRKPTGWLRVKNATAHNLQGIDVDLPLGVVAAITGPSGSGKSTLIRDIVYRSVARALGDYDVEVPGTHGALEGLRGVTSVVLVDQSPLGRTSRGNAATYTKAWDRLRTRFAEEPLAIAQGLTPSDFSFNVSGGRCEACSGEGYETVEMQFLADVSLLCPVCRGKRFQPRVLEVRHRGLSVADVLEKTVDEVLDLFADDRALVRALGVVRTLGLGYLPLGQPLNTLSGGEAQRLKLARALSAPAQGALFVLDEPSAGLHGKDVAAVLAALDLLVAGGGSVLVVEHDTMIVRASDWVVDLGPGAGRHGGSLVEVGTPEELLARGKGKTAEALRSFEQRADKKGKKATKPAIAPASPPDVLRVVRAREHNLREVSCDIPLGKLVVVTGPSGSGKSSLAFDVVFAEGQRRFLETLTPYARQFLPMMPRADVDSVTGVPPSIALEQRTSRGGAASTVATVTEVAHYLRLLYAKIGEVHCPKCDAVVSAMSRGDVRDRLVGAKRGDTLLALAVQARKGTYLDLFTSAARAGFTEAICDGARVSTDRPPKLKKTHEHTISIVIAEGEAIRGLSDEVLDQALSLGSGSLAIEPAATSKHEPVILSTKRACAACGTGVPELDPRWFSFHTKQGACPSCEGTGIAGGPEAVKEGSKRKCGSCGGARLSPLPRGVRLFGVRYHELMELSVARAHLLTRSSTLTGRAFALGEVARMELVRRLAFLENVGLAYLALGRSAATLSGGEMQRLRLSAQLGSGLTGALYVLDEPTIGLHPRDTRRLIENLRGLRDLGSTVLVVEHDADTIRAADCLLDLGPTGGQGGGMLLAMGPPETVLADPRSPTARAFAEPFQRARAPREDKRGALRLTGARANNLANVDISIPLGRLTVVAGPSGSGKSTLVRSVLLPAVRKALKLETDEPGPFATLTGTETIRRALSVDQSPIGRSPRSIPATFLGLWDEIRKLYAKMPDAQVRGFSPARFSFNTGSGGRCPVCEGQGVITHEMAFLPDVVTPCEVCNGLRFEPTTLEISYLGLSIGQTLKLTVSEAIDHFAAHPKIRGPLITLNDLGVGYLQLGQGSHTLSGGEAQRLKLAAELTATVRHEPTLYVLDEPTTGLHLGDVSKLIEVLARLVDRGDTVVVIEHHPWVMAAADHVIELGPEGGEGGGRIVAVGTPEDIARAGTATSEVVAEVLGFSAALGASAAAPPGASAAAAGGKKKAKRG